MPRVISVASFLAAACAFAIPHVFAQPAYPNKPIQIIVPLAAGGPTDALARAIAPELSMKLGVPVVVENRPGAGGSVGMQWVSRSPADGYVLGLGGAGTHSINPYVYEKLPYDPKSLEPIAPVASYASVLVCTPNLPATTAGELVAYANDHPGQVTMGSGGFGTTAHMAMEVLRTVSGSPIRHVPYRGLSSAMNDVIAGTISCAFDVLATALPQIRAGKVKALAVTSARRSQFAPSIPTMEESGVQGYSTAVGDLWLGLFAPAGTPTQVLEILSVQMRSLADSPGFQQRLAQQAFDPMQMTRGEFRNMLAVDRMRWGRVVKETGAKAE